MVDEEINVSYDDCINVAQSWKKLKSKEDYQAEFGHPVFTKFIEIEPESKGPLAIEQVDIDCDSDRYRYLIKTYFDMLEQSLDMLGPDLEPLEEEFQDLGKTHASFGVKPSFFYTLGEATFYGLDIVMGDFMTDEEKAAWKRVYKFLADNMVKGNKTYRPVVKTASITTKGETKIEV